MQLVRRKTDSTPSSESKEEMNNSRMNKDESPDTGNEAKEACIQPVTPVYNEAIMQLVRKKTDPTPSSESKEEVTHLKMIQNETSDTDNDLISEPVKPKYNDDANMQLVSNKTDPTPYSEKTGTESS